MYAADSHCQAHAGTPGLPCDGHFFRPNNVGATTCARTAQLSRAGCRVPISSFYGGVCALTQSGACVERPPDTASINPQAALPCILLPPRRTTMETNTPFPAKANGSSRNRSATTPIIQPARCLKCAPVKARSACAPTREARNRIGGSRRFFGQPGPQAPK